MNNFFIITLYQHHEWSQKPKEGKNGNWVKKKNNQKRDGSTKRLKKAKAKHETKIRNKMVLAFYIHSLTRRTQKKTKHEKTKTIYETLDTKEEKTTHPPSVHPSVRPWFRLFVRVHSMKAGEEVNVISPVSTWGKVGWGCLGEGR